MATITEEVIIPVKVEDTDEAVKDLNKVTDATEKTTKASEEQGETLLDTAKDARIFGISINSLGKSIKGMLVILKASTKGLKAFRIALIATGVGAIVVALGSLFVALTEITKVQDFFNRILIQTGSLFNLIIDRAGKLGGALIALFAGQFTVAVLLAEQAVDGFGQALEDAIESGGKIADLQVAIRDGQIEFVRLEGQLIANIEKLKRFRDDESRSLEDRIEATREQGRLEEQLEKARIRQADLVIAEIRQRLSEDEDNKDIQLELAEAENERFRQLEDGFSRQTEQITNINNLLREQQEELQTLIDLDIARIDKILTEEEKFNKQIIDLGNEETDEFEKQQQAKIDASIASAEADKQAEKEKTEARKESAQQGAQIAGELLAFQQQSALASIQISLAEALAKLFANNPILGAILTPILLGTFQAIGQRLLSAVLPSPPTFAKGGYIGGNLHSSGGTLIEAERGEYIINRRSMQDKGVADIAQALNNFGQAKGMQFQDGGFIGRGGGVISVSDIAQILERLPRAVLVTEDLNRVQNRIRVTDQRTTL